MITIKQSRTPEKHQHILGNIHLNFGSYYSKIKDYESAETHFQDAYKEYSEFYSGFIFFLTL
jgi:Tfp pilus assembly protein PilF